jgi:hypothetical protein
MNQLSWSYQCHTGVQDSLQRAQCIVPIQLLYYTISFVVSHHLSATYLAILSKSQEQYFQINYCSTSPVIFLLTAWPTDHCIQCRSVEDANWSQSLAESLAKVHALRSPMKENYMGNFSPLWLNS